MKCVRARELPEELLSRVVRIERENFGDAWSAAAFTVERDAGRLWYAMDGDTLCGYVVFWTIEDECEIANIAVDAPYRRRGVGGLLLECALTDGGSRFFLEVRESNTAARALYEKYGFTPYAVRKNYYKNPTENALLMCREGAV